MVSTVRSLRSLLDQQGVRSLRSLLDQRVRVSRQALRAFLNHPARYLAVTTLE